MHLIATQKDYQRPVMIASLLVSLLMLSGKMTAFFFTGSAAILSDALESVIHLLATGFAAFSLWLSIQPADAEHPYGHGKVAYFSSGFEGGLIFIAALGIMYTAIVDLIQGPEIHDINIGLFITGGLAVVNGVLGWALVSTGKRHNSIVLVANGHHVWTDMWTSVGVVVGLSLVWMTDVHWLDPLLAIVIAINILWTAIKLMKTSVKGLMEAADPADTQKIKDLLASAVQDETISGYHQLRHRRVNDSVWIEYHLHFPVTDSISEAHDKSHRVEKSIHSLFAKDHVIVTAHLEPDDHESAHQDADHEPGVDILGGDAQ